MNRLSQGAKDRNGLPSTTGVVEGRQLPSRAVAPSGRRPAMGPWTPERTELLRQLWAEGQTAEAIAPALGGECTRNAVIGKLPCLRSDLNGQIPADSNPP